ncbi:MAG: helix-turn-helix transcriptional regulator, partial [Tidjanibacter sp.]|nr:helix-turn-helix transcriptional regulator [Tidjanibacter sp.]
MADNKGVRVKKIRKDLEMTGEQFAALLGVGKSALSMIETGKAALSERNKNILVQDLNVNPDWLESGKGEMFNCPKEQWQKFTKRTDNTVPLQSVPLYNMEGTAGLVP